MYKIVLVMIVGLTASACQTLTKEQCQTANWQEVGYEDGLNGLPPDQINSHREACGKYKVVLLPEEYNRGRDNGLILYCQPGNGFAQGREGIEYHAVCSPRLEQEFLPAYEQGRMIGDSERELAAVLDVKRSLEIQIRNIDRNSDSRMFADLSRGERPRSMDLVLMSESMENEKNALRVEVQRLTQQIHDLSNEIESMLANSRFPI